MKTLISHISITKGYTVVTDVCQAHGKCAREGMSPNDYIYSTVFMKFLTLFRKKKQVLQIIHCGHVKSAQRDCAEECAVKSA